jgi:hypothetical protein
MAARNSLPPSFSRWRKWSIGLNAGLAILIIFAVVLMVNYLSGSHYQRAYLSTRAKIDLSPRTLSLLQSLTNRVKVTVYYDKNEPLYSTIAALLNEYRLNSSHLSVETVDYLRDSGSAQRLKAKYNLDSAADKNLVIFDCDGKIKRVDGNVLAEYVYEQVPNDKEREFRRKPTAFKGEERFTSALLDVTSPRPLKAYFLRGHGEHDFQSGDELEGYTTFAEVLQENYIQVEPLSLLGTNSLPMDCHLLIIAGPKTAIPEQELEAIDRYLSEGGRLLALFNARSANRLTGLERILVKWGVNVGSSVIRDPDQTMSGSDIVIQDFTRHPVVNPLFQSRLHVILPRMVGQLSVRAQAADAPKVEEIAFTGPRAFIEGEPVGEPKPLPLMVAVEKGAVRGVVTERGLTRMIVAGDSIFLGNRQIESAANRDFAGYAANWLLDRTQLLQGLGPRPITEYRLVMGAAQMQTVQWVLLGAMPGAMLLVGSLVWLRRRR